MNDRTKATLGTVVSILVAVLAVASEWQDMGPGFVTWSLRIVAILTVVSNVLGLRVVSLRRTDPGKVAGGAAVVLGLALVAIAATACNPYSAAKRSTFAVAMAGKGTAKVIALHGWAEHRACLAKGATKYRACAKGLHSRLEAWQTRARPAVRSAVSAAVVAIQAAEAAKSKKLDVTAILKAAGCALTAVAREWGPYLPDKAKAITTQLVALGPMVCPKRSVVGTVGIALTGAVELLKLILATVGKPSNVLLAEAAAWATAPPDDETEPLGAEVAASMGAP